MYAFYRGTVGSFIFLLKWPDRRKAKAAYLYGGDTFITYEDKQALQAKVIYVKEKTLAGAMVWEYSHDAEDGIIKYLSKHLNKCRN